MVSVVGKGRRLLRTIAFSHIRTLNAMYQCRTTHLVIRLVATYDLDFTWLKSRRKADRTCMRESYMQRSQGIPPNIDSASRSKHDVTSLQRRLIYCVLTTTICLEKQALRGLNATWANEHPTRDVGIEEARRFGCLASRAAN